MPLIIMRRLLWGPKWLFTYTKCCLKPAPCSNNEIVEVMYYFRKRMRFDWRVMKNLLAVFIFLLLLAGCKKDDGPSQISFVMNGVNYSYSVPFTTYDSISNFTANGEQQLSLHFGTANSLQGVVIELFQTLTPPGSTGFETGAYNNLAYDKACGYKGGYNGCHTFLMAYSDSVLLLDNSALDNTGVLNVTSFSEKSKTISGTFSCVLADSYGNLYTVSNGKFSNISFYEP